MYFPYGQIEMFTLPGFHPKYGTKLLPVTPEVIAKYQKQKAQQEAKRQSREKANHRQRFPPGRYLFRDPRPSGVVDNLAITLTEVQLRAQSIVLHVLRLDQPHTG